MSKKSTDNFTAEDYVKLRFPSTPALSPDGNTLIFSIKSINDKKKENSYKSALFIKKTGDEGYKQFTSGNYIDTAPQFSPQGNFLAFLSSRSEKTPQVYVMDLIRGGEAFLVTKIPQGVTSFNWSHNGKKIHFIARVNKEELDKVTKEPGIPSFILEPDVYEAYSATIEQKKVMRKDPRVIKEAYNREGTSYLEGRFSQPFVVTIEFPGNNTLENENKHLPKHVGKFGYHYTLGSFSIDDTRLFLSRIKDPAISLESEVNRIDLSDQIHEKILITAYGGILNFQTSPDGKYFSYEGIREEKIVYDNIQIFIYNIQDDKLENITEGYDRSATQSRWISNNNLTFLSTRNGKIEINKIDIQTKQVEEVISDDQNINTYSVSKDGNSYAYEVSHASFFVELFWCDGKSINKEQVTKVNNSYLGTRDPAKVEYFEFKRDNTSFQGWLMLPADHNGIDTLPVALEIHGGPAAMWSPHELTMWHEWNVLVSKGYAVIFTNPRGSDGYGIDFRSAVWKNWGELAGNDIMKAVDIALEKFSYLDGDRLVITGGSYGGYMTSWLITHFPNRFKAAVSQRGVYEYIAFATTTDIPVWFIKQYEGIYFEKIEDYLRDSPASKIEELNCPLLIIHSDNDYRVPVVNAEQLFWLGKYYKKTVELVRYPNEGHELSRSGRPRALIDRINRIINWFDKYN
ncbi:MAG: prolyl oligopeptidase family serine peptidase [Candidatus Hodarchaeales archaeon]|jgi:dipeptidyl aminopeptidase/acylaminoacyl peptidase